MRSATWCGGFTATMTCCLCSHAPLSRRSVLWQARRQSSITRIPVRWRSAKRRRPSILHCGSCQASTWSSRATWVSSSRWVRSWRRRNSCPICPMCVLYWWAVAAVTSGLRTKLLAEHSNVQLAGRFPPDAMPGILAQASALLVTLVRDPVMAQTIPSKVQAYLAAGKPILAVLDGEGANVVREASAGIACSAEDALGLRVLYESCVG